VWGTYFDDLNRPWALRVDDDYFRQPARGWFTQASSDSFPFPRGWFPRRVIGVDTNGNFRTAVAPSTSSPIWTGGSLFFSIEASDQSLVSCQVVGRLQELRSAAP
jgi:hypothetical protein